MQKDIFKKSKKKKIIGGECCMIAKDKILGSGGSGIVFNTNSNENNNCYNKVIKKHSQISDYMIERNLIEILKESVDTIYKNMQIYIKSFRCCKIDKNTYNEFKNYWNSQNNKSSISIPEYINQDNVSCQQKKLILHKKRQYRCF